MTAEDHSLSRFVGSKRAMDDDSEQLADVVYTDKRKQHFNRAVKDKIVTYLNGEHPCSKKVRDICIELGCHCRRTTICDCGNCE